MIRKPLFLILVLIISSACQAQTPLNDKALEQYIAFRHDHNRYSGITEVFQGDKLIFSSIHGLANRENDIPVRRSTRFDLASATKMFTTVAIGILMERDQLAPEHTIGEMMPGFPAEEVKGVSVQELLSHTSGISDLFFHPSYLRYDRTRLRSLSDYEQFYHHLEITSSDPGFTYSNSNYMILGSIIESVTGQDYYRFVEKEIMDPLEMSRTGFFEQDALISDMADGYYVDPRASVEFGVPNDGQIRNNAPLRMIKGVPAGGAYSTTHDMHRFMRALADGQLLTPETLSQFTKITPHGYGMGFQSYILNDIPVWGHSGGFYGVSTMVFYLPEQDMMFTSLTNMDFAAQPVFDQFLASLSGETIPKPVHLSKNDLTPFDGYYHVTSGDMQGKDIRIEALDDRLLFDGALEFFPLDESTFFDIDNPSFELRFEETDDSVSGFYRTDDLRYHQKATSVDKSEVFTPDVITLSEQQMREYLVNFTFDPDGMMPNHTPTFTADGNALIVDNMMRFLPYEKDRFFMEDDTGMKLHFIRNKNNEIVRIHVLRGDQTAGTLRPAE